MHLYFLLLLCSSYYVLTDDDDDDILYIYIILLLLFRSIQHKNAFVGLPSSKSLFLFFVSLFFRRLFVVCLTFDDDKIFFKFYVKGKNKGPSFLSFLSSKEKHRFFLLHFIHTTTETTVEKSFISAWLVATEVTSSLLLLLLRRRQKRILASF